MMYKIFRKTKAVTGIFVLIAGIILLIIFGKESSRGIKDGIYFCAEVLVPSLFPFMILSSLAVRSGICERLGRLIDTPSRLFFGLSGCTAAIIMLGIIGGYPVGARGISALYESGQISEYEAKKASYSAVCAGPGFTVTFVGIRLLGSAETGLCLFAAQALSVILLCVFNSFVFREKPYSENKSHTKSENALVESVENGARGAIEMCAMVVAFSAVNSVLEKHAPFITVFSEVTAACNILSKNNIAALAFAVGFGGLCVHFQIFQALKGIGVKKLLFFSYRIMQGLITVLLFELFARGFGLSTAVFSSFSSEPQLSLSTSLTGSFLLILTGVCFIYNVKKG